VGKVPITVLGYRCERCRHEWVPIRSSQEPRVCPKCKSPYWNRPKAAAPITYESFRDRVKTVLRRSKPGLTWTEVRAASNHPHPFPNNRWVRRLERDIGLTRERDLHGIIRWRTTGRA
jgi:hypothetical protein